jgi:hypothetical protein
MMSTRQREAARKREKRAAERDAGWLRVSVLVAAENADTVRDFAAMLPGPGMRAVPGQLDIFDLFDPMSESESGAE